MRINWIIKMENTINKTRHDYYDMFWNLFNDYYENKNICERSEYCGDSGYDDDDGYLYQHILALKADGFIHLFHRSRKSHKGVSRKAYTTGIKWTRRVKVFGKIIPPLKEDGFSSYYWKISVEDFEKLENAGQEFYRRY